MNYYYILPSFFVGSGSYTVTAIVVAGLIGYAYVRWKVNSHSFILGDPRLHNTEAVILVAGHSAF